MLFKCLSTVDLALIEILKSLQSNIRVHKCADLYVSYNTHKQNLLNNQELLKVMISSLILMTFVFGSAVIL